MSRLTRAVLLTTAVAMLLPAAAWAYPPYPSEIVGFNGPPINNVGDREMFNQPQNSGTTNIFIQNNDPNHVSFNEAYRSNETELNPVGDACLKVYFSWLNPLDPNGWVRLNTIDSALRPNPSLHTQGKVRFLLTNKGDESYRGPMGLCLGIRETGVVVPQLRNGGSSGAIEFVGVSKTPTGITAGADRIVQTTATGGDTQVFPVGYNFAVSDPNAPYDTPVILPAAGQPLQTAVTSGDDQFRRGYYLDNRGVRTPIPAITLDTSAFAYALEWDLSTGNVTVDGVFQDATDPGGIAPFAGNCNGILDPANNRGTLEHLAITNRNDPADPPNAATKFDFGIDELQFEAPVPDPTTPPAVQSPIIQGTDITVTVGSLMYSTNRVELFKNGTFSQGTDITPGDMTPLQYTETCAAGDYYQARLRNDQDGTWSDLSPQVLVLAGPPPYSMSLMIDENGGGSCVATGWEWVGVTSVAGYVPQGYNLIVPNDAVWQTIDIPLDDGALVKATPFGGNGILGPSSSGTYTMDSVWFSMGPGLDPADPNNQGPFEVLMDAIQYLDPNGNAVTIIDEETTDQFSFARGQSPQTTLTYGRTTAGSYDGNYSHVTGWSYTASATSLGELQRIGSACATQPPIPSTATTIRYHIVARGKPTAPGVALPIVSGPIIGAQTGVRVAFDPNQATADSVQLYVNGVAVGSPQVPDPNFAYLDFTGLTLALGDSVSATQVIGGSTSDFAYPRASAAPTVPSVGSPLYPAMTTVTVNNITNAVFARASQVNVIVRNANGTIAQNVPKVLDPNGVTSTTVTVTALVTNQTVTATQTVNSIVSAESPSVTVAVSAPVITMAPAEGASPIRIQDCVAGATQVNLYVYADPNQTTPIATYSGVPDANGVAYVTIPARSALVAGQMIKASQVYLGNESPQSEGDPVTVTTQTNCNPSWVPGPPFPDTFETYTDQADLDNDTYPTLEARDRGWWNSSGDPSLTLVDSANPYTSTDPNHPITSAARYYKNATPGGTKSLYQAYPLSPRLMDPNDHIATSYENAYQCNFDMSYPDPNWVDVISSWSAPIVWNVNIYDTGGAGFNGAYQWAEMRQYIGGSLGGLIAVGMPGTGFFPTVNNNYYSARVNKPGSYVYYNPNVTGAPTRSVGWHTFTIVVKPVTVDVYVDGVLSHKNLPRSNIYYNNFYCGSGYSGTSDGWYDDYDVKTGAVYFGVRLPNYPIMATPLKAGDTTVSLSRIEPGATAVTVLANGSPIGSVDPAGATSLVVPVTALVKGDMLTTTTTNGLGTSEPSPAFEVGGGNGALLVSLGIRETNETTALGGVGGTSGPIEWIAASGTYPAYTDLGVAPPTVAPIGTKVITVQDGWQTITFDSATDPITGWPASGDGAIDPNKPNNGVLEHLAITVDPNNPLKSSGPYALYIDEIVNVGAGTGGADFLITGFEGYTPPAEVLFQEPTYSGSTSWNLALLPSASESSTEYAAEGTQSEKITWFFKDTTAGRWIRLTTSGPTGAVMNRPVINHRLPIRIKFKLSSAEVSGACCDSAYGCTLKTQAQCTAAAGVWQGANTTCTPTPCYCRADTNCDHVITYADINPFVRALNDPNNCCHFENCDVNGDGIISYGDINPFVSQLNTHPPCPY